MKWLFHVKRARDILTQADAGAALSDRPSESSGAVHAEHSQGRGRHLHTPQSTSPGRRLTTLGAALVSVLIILFMGPAANAATAPNGAQWYSMQTRCDAVLDTVARHSLVYPKPGWSSQYVRFRTYFKDLRTPSNSGWGNWTAPGIVYADKIKYQTIDFPRYIGNGQKFQMYTEIQWWDGYRWVGDLPSAHGTSTTGTLVTDGLLPRPVSPEPPCRASSADCRIPGSPH